MPPSAMRGMRAAGASLWACPKRQTPANNARRNMCYAVGIYWVPFIMQYGSCIRHSVYYMSHSVLCTVYCVPCNVYHELQHPCALCRMHSAVCAAQCLVRSLCYAVCRIWYDVCAMQRVSCTTGSVKRCIPFVPHRVRTMHPAPCTMLCAACRIHDVLCAHVQEGGLRDKPFLLVEHVLHCNVMQCHAMHVIRCITKPTHVL